jgi:hypothetical protein
MEYLGAGGGRLILLFINTVFSALLLHVTYGALSDWCETFTPLKSKLRGNQSSAVMPTPANPPLFRKLELAYRTQHAEVRERSRNAGPLLPGTPGLLTLRTGTGYGYW